MSSDKRQAGRDAEAIARRVSMVLSERVEALAPGRGQVKVERFENPLRISVALVPVDERAAELVFIVENGVPGLDVLCGVGTVFEITETRGAAEFDDEVGAFADAIISGNFKETIVRRGDAVSRVDSVIVLGGEPVTNRGRGGAGNRLRHPRREIIAWKPYYQD